MKRNISVMCILMIAFGIRLDAQSLKIGFRLEPTILMIETKNTDEISFTPYSIYLTALTAPADWLSVEIRPGLLLGGEDYSGFELGAFAHFKIVNNLRFIAGINNHFNGAGGHNGGESFGKNIFYKGIGIGYKFNSKLGIDAMYYFGSDNSYAYSWSISSSGEVISEKKMNGIIKFGFCLAWDIF